MSKPPLPGKRAPQAATALDKTLVLQLTGESDVADVRELVARGMGITTLDMASLGAHSWDRLEQLSLSHNKVGSAVWQWLGHCPSLKSLNLNFCDLDTLEGVQALPDLQKLYLSSNKVSDVEPLRSCTNLQTLSLYRNAMANLDECVAVLASLPALEDLDLSGNPIWFQPECKNRCVAAIASLRRYDDEDLTTLDREMADDYVEGGGGALKAQISRPSTAPARKQLPARPGSGDAATVAANGSSISFAMALPQGGAAAKLLAAASAGKDRPKSDGAAAGNFDTVELGSAGGSFVQRLRKSTTLLGEPVTRLRCEAAIPTLEECLAQPSTGVERLYAVVQELAKQLEDLRASKGSGSTGGNGSRAVDLGVLRALQKENAQLRLENSNMYFLKAESEALKQQMAALPVGSQGYRPRTAAAPRSGVADSSSSNSENGPLLAGGATDAEVAALRAELEELKQRHRILQLSSSANAPQRPVTAAEICEATEEYDEELAELFRRNEQGLAECRQSMKLAKAELGGGI